MSKATLFVRTSPEGDGGGGWDIKNAPPKANDGTFDEDITTTDDVNVKDGEPIVQADLVKNFSSTMYFDNGTVFTRSTKNQIHYIFNVKEEYEATISVAITYTDLVTNSTGTVPVIQLNEVKGNGLDPYYFAEGRESFANPIKINKCIITTTYMGIVRVFEQDCSTLPQISGRTLELHCNESVGSLINPINRDRITAYFAPDYEFESASFGDGRILSAENGGLPNQPYTYEYFLTDHLGSTRMVINDQEIVTEAIMYQPYGKMLPVGSIASPAIDVREKFTTKEFDEDGAPMGKLEFEMVFDLGEDDAVDLDKTKWNAIGVYYTDILTPRAEAVGDIIMLEVDEATNTAVAKASITYTADKQIKWIGIQLNGVDIEGENPVFAVNCAITPIDEDVGPGTNMTIHKIVENSSELETVVHKDSLTYTSTSCDLVGIGQYYFGARYYDPEVGVWGSCDKAGQFWNSYGYANSPIMYADEDGNLAWFVAPLIIGAIAGAYGGGTLANGSANPGDWDYSSGKTWGYMAGGAVIGGASGVLGAYVAGGTTMVPSIVPSIQMEVSYGLGYGGLAGLATSSTINSLGMYAMSGGNSDITTNLGIGTMNWSEGKFSFANPFDDDPWFQNTLEIGGYYGAATQVFAGGSYIYDQIQKARLGSAYEIIKDIQDVNSSPWYGNYLGPGANSPLGHVGEYVKPIDKLDNAARLHDIAYYNRGANGISGALMNTKVIGADYKLAGGMILSMGSKLKQGGLKYAAFGSIAFIGMATGKFLMDLRY